MIFDIPRFARTPLAMHLALSKLYVTAVDKLIDMGWTTKRLRARKNIIAAVELATSTPVYANEEDFLTWFVGAQQPRARNRKVKPMINAAPVVSDAVSTYTSPRGAYKLPKSMQVAFARANKEQCELVALVGKLGYVHHGGRDS